MEGKLFNFHRIAIITSALLFGVACFFDGWLKVLFFVLALIGAFLFFPKVTKIKSVGTKCSYAMYIFLLFTRLTMALGFVVASNIFSFVTMVFALIVVTRSVMYLQKYCKKDIDEHLDEL